MSAHSRADIGPRRALQQARSRATSLHCIHADCELLPLLERDAAFLPEVVQGILEADAIFITGSSQSRLMGVCGKRLR